VKIKGISLSIISFLLILVGASASEGHGLSKDDSKTIVLKRIGKYSAKVVVAPKNIEFVRPNNITVSIIDTVMAEHFYGNVGISVSSMDTYPEIIKLSQNSFDKGLFKVRTYFQKKGKYSLNISIANKDTSLEFPFVFEVRDDRIAPATVLICSLFLFFLFLGLIYFIKQRPVKYNVEQPVYEEVPLHRQSHNKVTPVNEQRNEVFINEE